MKKATSNPKQAIQLLNEFYAQARQRFAPGAERLKVVGLLNSIHDDICDGTQAECSRCAEFAGGGS
jgi:hypothetical protein